MDWHIIEDMPHAAATDVNTGDVYTLRIKDQRQGNFPAGSVFHYHLELLTPNGWTSLHHIPTLEDPRNESGNQRRSAEIVKQLKKYAAYLYEGDLQPIV